MESGNSAVLLQIVNSQKIICPTKEELQIEHCDYVCPSEGCDKVFQTSSQLQMHLTRHHHGQSSHRKASQKSSTKRIKVMLSQADNLTPRIKPKPTVTTSSSPAPALPGPSHPPPPAFYSARATTSTSPDPLMTYVSQPSCLPPWLFSSTFRHVHICQHRTN